MAFYVGGNPVSTPTTLNAIGTSAFCRYVGASSLGPGATIAGSNLRYTNLATGKQDATVPSGTWRCMGDAASGGTTVSHRTTVWTRIS